MTKTELDLDFDYPQDESVIKYHNENIFLTIIFSLLFVGWSLLILVLFLERMVLFVRQVRIVLIWLVRRITKMKVL